MMIDRSSSFPVMRSARRLPVLVGLVAIMLAGSVGAPLASAQQSGKQAAYVEWTGHTFGAPFTSAWESTGGWVRYGLPVTEVVDIQQKETQFFEYGVIAVKGKESERWTAGKMTLLERHNPVRDVAGRRVGSPRQASAFIRPSGPTDDGVALYSEKTGFSVAGDMLDYYQLYDGRKFLGDPISGVYTDRGLRVQWFERGRIEQPLNGDEMRRGAVGAELAHLRDISTMPVEQGKLKLFEPERFVRYEGDGTYPEAQGRFRPSRIQVPDIGIDAFIENVGIVDNVMQTPEDAWNVGWYTDISYPGDRTNVVTAGHRDWWGMGPVVFWDLPNLWVGAKIYLLDENGRGGTYVVKEIFNVGAGVSADDVISDSGREIVTLITCAGNFNGSAYEERAIVQAERI